MILHFISFWKMFCCFFIYDDGSEMRTLKKKKKKNTDDLDQNKNFSIILLSTNPPQDCLTNGSKGQTKQDLAVQHHQLRNRVQALPVSCNLRPHLWLSNIDTACWLCKKTKKKTQAFESKCLTKLLRTSYAYLEHKPNEWVRCKINFLVGPSEPLLTTVKRRTLACHMPWHTLQNI